MRIQSDEDLGGMTYCGVVIRKGVIDGHVFEVPLDMGMEETLDFFIIELGVDEYSSNVGLDNVRQALSCGLVFNKDFVKQSNRSHTFGGFLVVVQ